VLNTLEKYEFVKRSPAAADGRSVIVELTPKGEEVIAELFRRNNHREVDWLPALSEAERQTLVELLRKVLHHNPPPPGEALVTAPPLRDVTRPGADLPGTLLPISPVCPDVATAGTFSTPGPWFE
jgi:hypothetical protein